MQNIRAARNHPDMGCGTGEAQFANYACQRQRLICQKTGGAAHLTSLLLAFSGSAGAAGLVTDEGFQGGVLMNGADDVRFPTEATSLFIAAFPKQVSSW